MTLPSINELLGFAQQSTGKRQKMALAIMQLQMVLEAGDNLRAEQRSALQSAIADLYSVVPPKRSDTTIPSVA